MGVTGAFGGGSEIDADPADGMLDLVVIEAGSRARLMRHAYGLRSGAIEQQPGVITRSGCEIEVRTDGGGFNVDGELVDAGELTFSLACGRLRGGDGMTTDPRRLRVRPPKVERREDGMRRAARKYWPLGAAAAAGLGWYAADSLRHRREGAFGYEIGTELEVGSADFMRAAEALTGAPIVEGNSAELLINGDNIFPAFIETIASAERTLNVQTYVYWRGDIADEVAGAICEKARGGVDTKVILDALGAAQMQRSLIARDARRGRRGAPVPPAEAVRDQARRQPHPPPRAGRRRRGRDDRRRRGRLRVDRRRGGARALARHPRARPRPGGPRAFRAPSPRTGSRAPAR